MTQNNYIIIHPSDRIKVKVDSLSSLLSLVVDSPDRPDYLQVLGSKEVMREFYNQLSTLAAEGEI